MYFQVIDFNLSKKLEKVAQIISPEIHWAVSDIGEDSFAEWLSEDEKKHLAECKSEHRRREFVSGRKMARQLADDMGIDLDAFSLQKNEMGKPFGITAVKRYHVSLAHSSKKVMCALSENIPLGVDLEPESREVHSRLGNRIYHPQESPEVRVLPLIRLWTIKEALVKLQGDGLRTNLKDVCVERLSNLKFVAQINNDKTAIICSFRQQKHWIAISYFQ